MVVHVYNPSTRQAEEGGLLQVQGLHKWVQGHSGICGENLSHKRKRKPKYTHHNTLYSWPAPASLFWSLFCGHIDHLLDSELLNSRTFPTLYKTSSLGLARWLKCLKALGALAEDQSSVPSTKIAWNSSSKGSNALFWYLWSLHSCAHTHRET